MRQVRSSAGLTLAIVLHAKRKLQRALDAETLQGRRLFKMRANVWEFQRACDAASYKRLAKAE